jgi:hypothetical protein
MSFSFEDKLAAIEHELALRQWWQNDSHGVKAFKVEASFHHIQVLEAIARDYRGAVARRKEPVNVGHLRVVRSETDD